MSARDHTFAIPHLVGRTAHLLGRRGFALDEAFTLGLLAPGRSDDEIASAVSKREMLAAQARLNPNEFWYWTEDKAVFYRHAETVGVPVPRLYAVLCESGPGWSYTGDVLADPSDWARLLTHGLPDRFVIKPARGYYGLGVRLIERRDGRLYQLGSGEIDAGELCRELVADRQFHIHVIQERLENHPDMPGGDALQAIRIATLVQRDGTVSIVSASFKTAIKGAVIDNFRGGATGNLSSIVDVRDGTVLNLTAAGVDGVVHPVEPPPEVNAPIPGVTRLPMWDECCEAVRAAAPAFLPMRTLGWDVAVTPEGVRIVEANMWWDPVGVTPELREAFGALRQA